MLVPILLFILGLVLLIFGGDWFVDGAVGIAKRLHVPEILIGATVVSIGTTLPEVMVSATSAAIGYSATAYGNAIGSIICNTALVLAITIAIRPAAARAKDIIMPSCFFFGAAIFYAFNAYFFGGFGRWAGIVLLCIFVAYMAISVRNSVIYSKNSSQERAVREPEVSEKENLSGFKAFKETTVFSVILLIVGAAGIAFGADLLVDNGVIIAEMLGVPESVIALTFIALGTSLPELVTAITSLVKKHGSLSLGNIIGANLFNLVFVSGLSITIAPFELPAEMQIAGINSSLLIDLPLAVAVMLIVVVPVLIKNKLYRVQGIVLLALYASFCAYCFIG